MSINTNMLINAKMEQMIWESALDDLPEMGKKINMIVKEILESLGVKEADKFEKLNDIFELGLDPKLIDLIFNLITRRLDEVSKTK